MVDATLMFGYCVRLYANYVATQVSKHCTSPTTHPHHVNAVLASTCNYANSVVTHHRTAKVSIFQMNTYWRGVSHNIWILFGGNTS